MTPKQKEIYSAIREGIRTHRKNLVEYSARQLYKFLSNKEKELVKRNMTEEQRRNPAAEYGKNLADTLIAKGNARGTLTRKEILESQEYFGLRMTDELRGATMAMKGFRSSQRRDYEAFRRLSGAPNSYKEIATDLKYKGGDRTNGYKYEYVDKEGRTWEIITPGYDKSKHATHGYLFSQVDGTVKADDENTKFTGSLFS